MKRTSTGTERVYDDETPGTSSETKGTNSRHEENEPMNESSITQERIKVVEKLIKKK